jgi:hypothetical protein
MIHRRGVTHASLTPHTRALFVSISKLPFLSSRAATSPTVQAQCQDYGPDATMSDVP